MFGVAQATAMFQRVMDVILQRIPHVVCYIDDTLITGADDQELSAAFGEPGGRFGEHGVHLRMSKCSFLQDNVKYLGHWLAYPQDKSCSSSTSTNTSENQAQLQY